MRKIVLFFIALAFTGRGAAQDKLSGDQLAVQQIMAGVFESLTNRDSVTLKELCSRDVRFYEYGMTWTIDSLIRRGITENQATDFTRTNSLEFLETAINGQTAWATYRLRSIITRAGKETQVEWLETVVLVKDKKRWILKVLHSSLLKRT